VSKRSKRTKAATVVEDPAETDARRTWIFSISIAAVVGLAFLPAMRNGFVSWDDAENFLQNPHYRGLGPTNLAWMWTTFRLGHYVPLTWMTLGLDYALWGMNPAGYHATSILIHAVNASLLFILARNLFRRSRPSVPSHAIDWAAAFAALVFALHPLRVESVVWITERRDVLSLFFYLLAILVWLRSLSVETNRAKTYWVSALLFVCALLSKATAMTLPAVLLLLDVYPLRRLTKSTWLDLGSTDVRRVYLEIIPFGLLTLGTVFLSIVALHPPPQLGFGAKIAVSAFSFCFYLLKTAVPTRLSPLYEMPAHVDPVAGVYAACYAAIVIIVIAALSLRKRWPGLVAAFVGFALISLPMLGFVQNGPQIAADRYTYHSSPALALIAGAGVFFVLQIPAWARFTLASVTLGVLTVATIRQTGLWRDSTVLWSRVLELDPSSSVAHSALASLLFKEDRIPEGLEHARWAVELSPNYAQARNDLGVGLMRSGDVRAGISELQRSLALNPAYHEAENNLGVAESQTGNLADAFVHYQRAVALNPDYADAHVNMGNLLVREQKIDEAIPHYAEALNIQPDNADAQFNWGVALAQQAKYGDAIAHFRAAVAIRPDFAVAKQYIERAEQLESAKRGTPTSPTSR
jgi:tetratricopeptide (TPR) repeat protein